MKIDFHTHVKLNKRLPFSSEYTDWLFEEAKTAGLDAICMTEHFNTLGFSEVYQYIADAYPREGDTFMGNGLRIFPGMEIDIAEGGHILALGKMEEILSFNEALAPYKEKGNFLPFSALLEMAETFKVYLGAAHPYRKGSAIPTLDEDLLKKLHFVDLNGKDYAERGEEAELEVVDFAKKLNLPIVAGSDTHQAFQYGCIYTELNQTVLTIEELVSSVKTVTPDIEIHPDVTFKVKTAGTLKKALKQIHALGGDYLSVLIKEDIAK